MIIVRVMGGLGNQLFQYACAYALAKRLGQELKLDISFYPKQSLRGFKLNFLQIEYHETAKPKRLVRVFNNKFVNKLCRILNISIIPLGSKKKYFLETRSKMMNKIFSITANTLYLDCYYQSPEYFKGYEDEIIKQFKPLFSLPSRYYDILKKMNSCNSVAVHVRRGDFLNSKKDPNPRCYLLGKDYYYAALDYIRSSVDNPVFFWFSDDIKWVKENFGCLDCFEFVTIDGSNSDICELMLMSKCKNIIAANSTFSWWATWLNDNKDSIKIVPKRRYGNPKMIPNDWIKL